MSPVLIIRVSQRLAKRLKIRMSPGSYVQGVPLLSWNADELIPAGHGSDARGVRQRGSIERPGEVEPE